MLALETNLFLSIDFIIYKLIFFLFLLFIIYSQFVRDTIFSIAFNGQLEGHWPIDRRVCMRITMWATLIIYVEHCSSSLIYFFAAIERSMDFSSVKYWFL